MRQKNSTTRRSGTRMFVLALAGATAVIAGSAATLVATGGVPMPAQFLARVTSPADTEQMAPNSPALSVSVLSSGVSASVTATSASATVDLAPALKAADAAARTSAMTALAQKLARLQLARRLLAARERSTAGTMVASAPSLAVDGNGETSLGTSASAGAQAEATVAPTTVVASLAAAPAKPGAILPPTPDIKPDVPRRSVSSDRRRTAEPETAAPVLAYARPGTPEDDESGVFGGLGKLFSGPKGGLPGASAKVAVYDISAATVHMPDGTKLEAHSGIGHRMDNPKYAHVRMAGPTPPNIYRLRMRERRFHGVEAIRMLPTDRAAMKGRDGMLTHTRLLRRSIGSHGCVAFKDYNKFLNAFKAGKVKTMIVVPSMEKLPTYLAKLERGMGA